METSFERQDDQERGRHLRATRNILKGEIIFLERPLLRQQSLENRRTHILCQNCYSFCGSPSTQLRYAFPYDENDPVMSPQAVIEADDSIIPCRYKCGHVFCCRECESDGHDVHRVLCTGLCEDETDSLVQFKVFAAQTNEMLLLIAEWWVAQHVLPNEAYTDFSMDEWTDIALREFDRDGSSIEQEQMLQSLRSICTTAAELLGDVCQRNAIPCPTARDISLRMGCLEQNCMGIRRRSPLCQEILGNANIRIENHNYICQALVEAGFLGNDKSGDGEEGSQDSLSEVGETECYDEYTVQDVEKILTGLFWDADGTVLDSNSMHEGRQRDSVGDDWDYLFQPLDGTAMLATACKMNHSCSPNVMVSYPFASGKSVPLIARCFALRDITASEELTISYIDVERRTLEERRKALSTYGFSCHCKLCMVEGEQNNAIHLEVKVADAKPLLTTMSENRTVVDDLFGSDESTAASIQEELNNLQDVELRCETVSNRRLSASVPLRMVAKVANFVLHSKQTTTEPLLTDLWNTCCDAISGRDFHQCRLVGHEMENILWGFLKSEGWPTETFRVAYWSACVAIALGLAHEESFLDAMAILDKAMVLGLNREGHRVKEFVSYVESHARRMMWPRYIKPDCGIVPNFLDPSELDRLVSFGIGQPLQHRVCELSEQVVFESVEAEFLAVSRPVVLRKMAHAYPALSKWRHMSFFVNEYGHRLVPVELGSMLDIGGGMKEDLLKMRTFIGRFLPSESLDRVCSLSEALNGSARVAYLAQHPLIGQIPSLQRDIDVRPGICGPDGPTHVNVWMGTAGTRTPLHFDSYDNWLVQLVGAKYVRLYGVSETEKLYVNNGGDSFAWQQNMSDLDCENEDYCVHPLAKEATYTEALLLPGDALFIPNRTWHYVRSLTASVSVNYWF